MADFSSQWKQLVETERRTSRDRITPGNLYQISVYSNSKKSSHRRYIFAIGKSDDKLHCLKLNNIKPVDFSNFLHSIRNKQRSVDPTKPLSYHLIKFGKEGKRVFESYIKPNKSIYGSGNDTYRTYKVDKITYVSELVFEGDVLDDFLGRKTKVTNRRVGIDTELDERDG